MKGVFCGQGPVFAKPGPWGGSPVHIEPQRLLDVDDERVLALVRVTATGPESGIEVDVRAAHEFTIRNGLAVRVKFYSDCTQALKAVGLEQG